MIDVLQAGMIRLPPFHCWAYGILFTRNALNINEVQMDLVCSN
jgi:hypothetical protein